VFLSGASKIRASKWASRSEYGVNFTFHGTQSAHSLRGCGQCCFAGISRVLMKSRHPLWEYLAGRVAYQHWERFDFLFSQNKCSIMTICLLSTKHARILRKSFSNAISRLPSVCPTCPSHMGSYGQRNRAHTFV